MATSSDYTGRKVDLSIYPKVTTAGVPVVGGIGPTSRAISGPGKVAQNFGRILLTPLGTYRAYPLLGSNFLLRVRQGAVRFDVDLLHLFSGESLNVITFMNSVTPSTAPLDEQIDSATLTNYSVAPGKISLTIQIVTKAGVGTTFLLPVIWNN